MRLFVAVDIPQATREAISEFIIRLKLRANGLKWVDASNLHLTLKFIGESTDLAMISDCLVAVPGPQFEIALRDLGSFPRVLWIGVHAPPALGQLAQRIDQALAPLGIPVESRPFSPHLTLARAKDGRIPKFDEHPDFGSFPVSEFVVYESKLASSGATYITRGRFPLVQSA